MLYFLYIGTWEARFVRHTLPLVPFLCLFAGGMLAAILQGASSKPTGLRVLSQAAVALVVTFSALWGLAFLSIYTTTDTRLAATAWFHANVPLGTHVVIEDKDTLIPLPDPAHPVQNYRLGVIEPTAPTSGEGGFDSLYPGRRRPPALSSRRWSGTISHLADFPLTARYQLFFAWVSPTPPSRPSPTLPGSAPAFSDDTAQETFQVFDHPTVRIFRNTGHLTATDITSLLEGSDDPGK